MSTANPAEIVTVRPEKTTMTKQQLPNFVGISGTSTGARCGNLIALTAPLTPASLVSR